MEDPTTIALHLTFFGTLGVAFVMFLGLFIVFAVTLVIAGIGRLAVVVVVALAGVFSGRPAETLKTVKSGEDGKTAPPRKESRQEGTRTVAGVGRRRRPGRCPRHSKGEGRSRAGPPSVRPEPAEPQGAGA